MGICVHPEMGGWFSLRFVLIPRSSAFNFDFARPQPLDVFADNPNAAVEVYINCYSFV